MILACAFDRTCKMPLGVDWREHGQTKMEDGLRCRPNEEAGPGTW